MNKTTPNGACNVEKEGFEWCDRNRRQTSECRQTYFVRNNSSETMANSLAATPEKKQTSNQMSLMTVAWNRSKVYARNFILCRVRS